MELWMDLLFGNWIGLLSMFTIAFMLVMMAYLWGMFLKRSKPTDNTKVKH
ncbi:MAG: DUF3149 domain-containing protein [Gammaproteobacteria bacterium]|nr:DUF3149 domain-containing protein [Gammaproteobacteria bacterium]